MTAISKSPNNNGGGKLAARAGLAPERAMICAKNIMTEHVVSVGLDKTVRDIARLLSEHHFSAVPVVDRGAIVGIVTEGDIFRRAELGTDAPNAMARADTNFAKAYGRCAGDVMTPNVVSVTEQTPLGEIAELMESKHIRRVPVVRDGKLVGIVSRADLVRTLAERPVDPHAPLPSDDDIIRFRVIETLLNIPGASVWLGNVNVSNGVVHLSGTVEDETVREPSRIAVEKIPYVKAVTDHRCILQPY